MLMRQTPFTNLFLLFFLSVGCGSKATTPQPPERVDPPVPKPSFCSTKEKDVIQLQVQNTNSVFFAFCSDNKSRTRETNCDIARINAKTDYCNSVMSTLSTNLDFSYKGNSYVVNGLEALEEFTKIKKGVLENSFCYSSGLKPNISFGPDSYSCHVYFEVSKDKLAKLSDNAEIELRNYIESNLEKLQLLHSKGNEILNEMEQCYRDKEVESLISCRFTLSHLDNAIITISEQERLVVGLNWQKGDSTELQSLKRSRENYLNVLLSSLKKMQQQLQRLLSETQNTVISSAVFSDFYTYFLNRLDFYGTTFLSLHSSKSGEREIVQIYSDCLNMLSELHRVNFISDGTIEDFSNELFLSTVEYIEENKLNDSGAFANWDEKRLYFSPKDKNSEFDRSLALKCNNIAKKSSRFRSIKSPTSLSVTISSQKNREIFNAKLTFEINGIPVEIAALKKQLTLIDSSNIMEATPNKKKQAAIIMMDSSGSMSENDTNIKRKYFAIDLVKGISKNTNLICFLDFDNEIQPIVCSSKRDARFNNFENVIEAIQSIDNRGGTEIGKVIESALSYIKQNPSNYHYELFLVTDGHSNSPYKNEHINYDPISNELSFGITTVGFSTRGEEFVDSALLTLIAQDTNRTYQYTTGLDSTFKQTFNSFEYSLRPDIHASKIVIADVEFRKGPLELEFSSEADKLALPMETEKLMITVVSSRIAIYLIRNTGEEIRYKNKGQSEFSSTTFTIDKADLEGIKYLRIEELDKKDTVILEAYTPGDPFQMHIKPASFTNEQLLVTLGLPKTKQNQNDEIKNVKFSFELLDPNNNHICSHKGFTPGKLLGKGPTSSLYEFPLPRNCNKSNTTTNKMIVTTNFQLNGELFQQTFSTSYKYGFPEAKKDPLESDTNPPPPPPVPSGKYSVKKGDVLIRIIQAETTQNEKQQRKGGVLRKCIEEGLVKNSPKRKTRKLDPNLIYEGDVFDLNKCNKGENK